MRAAYYFKHNDIKAEKIDIYTQGEKTITHLQKTICKVIQSVATLHAHAIDVITNSDMEYQSLGLDIQYHVTDVVG